MCVRVVLLLLIVPTLALQGDATMGGTPTDVIEAIDRAQEKRELRLSGYSASEHYTVRNSHFSQTAELTATVVYQKGQGKTYSVLTRSGPGLLQERVINRILKEDALLSRNVTRSHNLLTSANYTMKVRGIESVNGTPCYAVLIFPRAHNFALIEGVAWFDVNGLSLLRIEGKPAASPSFWTGKPTIEREYTVLNGLSFPIHSRATSKGLLTGKSQLDIDYTQYALLE